VGWLHGVAISYAMNITKANTQCPIHKEPITIITCILMAIVTVLGLLFF
jgi:hypothetical protein